MTSFTLRRIALAGAASAATLLAAGAANAAGFYLQEQSVRGLGRAYSGEVADTGPASLWWNPASIAGSKRMSAYGGISAILPHGKVSNVGTLIIRPGQAPAAVGGNQVSRNPLNKGFLPAGGVSYPLNDEWSVGFVMTAPYSFATNYDNGSWARYTADKTKLTTFDLQPTVAWQMAPEIGIGVGINIERAKASLSNSVPNLSPLLPDGHQTLRGKGWDFGFSVGAQIHPTDGIDIGLSYKSSVKHVLKGSITTAGLLGPLAGQNGRLNGVTASFRTPWQIIGGVRVRAAEKLHINGQVTRAGWKKFDAIRLGAPLNAALPQSYKSVWAVATGFDYDASDKLTVRAGVQFDQTPTQDGARDARVPDASRVNYNVGASYKWNDRITLDVAANYVDFKKETIDRPGGFFVGTPAQTIILPNGRVQARAIILGLGARMDF